MPSAMTCSLNAKANGRRVKSVEYREEKGAIAGVDTSGEEGRRGYSQELELRSTRVSNLYVAVSARFSMIG